LNARLCDDYSKDTASGIVRWNKIIERAGINFAIELPHVAFHRGIGEFSSIHTTPAGAVITAAEFQQGRNQWLPSAEDGEFIASLMLSETARGRFAGWIAAPKLGINNMPGDFEYVQT